MKLNTIVFIFILCLTSFILGGLLTNGRTIQTYFYQDDAINQCANLGGEFSMVKGVEYCYKNEKLLFSHILGKNEYIK